MWRRNGPSGGPLESRQSGFAHPRADAARAAATRPLRAARSDAAPISLATSPCPQRRTWARPTRPTGAVRAADGAGASGGLARMLAATLRRVGDTASVRRDCLASQDVERQADVAARRRIVDESLAAAKTPAAGPSPSSGDRLVQRFRCASVANPDRCASAKRPDAAAVHHVLAGPQASCIHRLRSFASSHCLGALALALHRAAASRPWETDPRRAPRRGGTRLHIRLRTRASNAPRTRRAVAVDHAVARPAEAGREKLASHVILFTTVTEEQVPTSNDIARANLGWISTNVILLLLVSNNITTLHAPVQGKLRRLRARLALGQHVLGAAGAVTRWRGRLTPFAAFAWLS
jgi:hypothetical protein